MFVSVYPQQIAAARIWQILYNSRTYVHTKHHNPNAAHTFRQRLTIRNVGKYACVGCVRCAERLMKIEHDVDAVERSATMCRMRQKGCHTCASSRVHRFHPARNIKNVNAQRQLFCAETTIPLPHSIRRFCYSAIDIYFTPLEQQHFCWRRPTPGLIIC